MPRTNRVEGDEMEQANARDLVKFRADPVLRRAIKLRAAYEDADLQDVIVAILTGALAEEIAEVRRRGLVADPKPTTVPKKPTQKKPGGGM